MINRISIFLLFSFLFVSILAQENKFILTGIVIDNNQKALADVSIIVDDKQEVYSLKDGSYTIQLSAGKHKINVIYFGHHNQEIIVDVKSNYKQNFTLIPNAFSLSTVEVQGKTKTEMLRESAYTVNAIDVKSIASEYNSLSDIIGRSSGIRIRESGGVGSDFDLSINGLSGNAIRYFLNGVPLASMGSEVNIANLPVNLIDRVEIYKGFVPAELGTDALGGVLNIITIKELENYLDASYGVGSFNTHKADFNAQYVDNKTGIIVRPSIGVNYSDNSYKMKGVEVANEETQRFETIDAKRFHDAYFSLLGQMQVGVMNKKWADSFFVTGSYSMIDKELQTGVTQNVVYGKAKRENDAYKIGLDYSKRNLFVDKLSTTLSFSHTWDHTLIIDTAYREYQWDGTFSESVRNEIRGRGRSKKHEKRPHILGRTNLDYQLSQNHSFNLNYLLDHIRNDKYDDLDQEFEPSNDKLVKHITGLSYSQHWWNDRLTNIFFLKDYVYHMEIEQQDFYWATGINDLPRSSTKNHIGYGVGSRFHISKNFSVKASYEYAVRLPLAREVLGNGAERYPNFGLRPEKSDNVNLGIFGEISLAENHFLNYEFGAFYRKVKDYIRYRGASGSSSGLSQYENVDDVSVKGLEGEIRYRYNNLLQLTVNGSYVDEVNKTKYQANGQAMATYNNKIPNKPDLYGNIELDLKKQDLFGVRDNQLKFKYHLQYVRWYYYSWQNHGDKKFKETIPTQVVNNISITYSMHNERYNLSLECSNMFNRLVYDNLRLQKPGRAFFCKFRIFIN